MDAEIIIRSPAEMKDGVVTEICECLDLRLNDRIFGSGES